MANDYHPKPLLIDHVELDDELLTLVERLAEHAHDIWAFQRIQDGWTFGPERCDKSKHHPCLIPYSQLPDTEKAYDRNVVLGTIRAILVLGFVVQRRYADEATQSGSQGGHPLQPPHRRACGSTLGGSNRRVKRDPQGANRDDTERAADPLVGHAGLGRQRS